MPLLPSLGSATLSSERLEEDSAMVGSHAFALVPEGAMDDEG